MNPQKVGFYEIIGNVDMAVRGNILFADSYVDLVPELISPTLTIRLRSAGSRIYFPRLYRKEKRANPYVMVNKSKGVIVDWEVKTVTEEHEPGSTWGGWIYREKMTLMAATDGGANWSAGAGTAGSMARFMLNDKYLHLIAHPWMLKTVDIEKAEKMSIVDSVNVSRNMETLFLLGNNMFVGTTTGMLIYDVTDATKPRQISHYDHISACDPVAADGDYAYVTLRTATGVPTDKTCWRSSIYHQLQILTW